MLQDLLLLNTLGLYDATLSPLEGVAYDPKMGLSLSPEFFHRYVITEDANDELSVITLLSDIYHTYKGDPKKEGGLYIDVVPIAIYGCILATVHFDSEESPSFSLKPYKESFEVVQILIAAFDQAFLHFLDKGGPVAEAFLNAGRVATGFYGLLKFCNDYPDYPKNEVVLETVSRLLSDFSLVFFDARSGIPYAAFTQKLTALSFSYVSLVFTVLEIPPVEIIGRNIPLVDCIGWVFTPILESIKNITDSHGGDLYATPNS